MAVNEKAAHQRCMDLINSFLVRETGIGLEAVPIGLKDTLEDVLFNLCYACQYPEASFKVRDTGEDPDFATTDLRLQLTLRWEYLPGSTLYLVYTRFGQGSVDDQPHTLARTAQHNDKVHANNLYNTNFSPILLYNIIHNKRIR